MPRLLASRSVPVLLATFVWMLGGCPQANQADPAAGKVAPVAAPVADARVVSDGTDLYPVKGGVVPKQAPPEPPSPGTGLTDESNGKCRLFAPELANPACCERQLGFDAAAVQAACDLKIYLGESFQGTCGYHFVPDATAQGMTPRWFRLSIAAEKTPKEAAEGHDRRSARVTHYVASTPIPGIEGAYWAEAEELHWAFLPGWKQVRMFTWSDESCGAAGIEKILRQLIAAPEVPAGTPRTALVPGGPVNVPAPADAKAGAAVPAGSAGSPATPASPVAANGT